MKLLEYLEKNHISQREFARRVGISNTYLADLIKGRNKYISSDVAFKINIVAPEVTTLVDTIKKYRLDIKE